MDSQNFIVNDNRISVNLSNDEIFIRVLNETTYDTYEAKIPFGVAKDAGFKKLKQAYKFICYCLNKELNSSFELNITSIQMIIMFKYELKEFDHKLGLDICLNQTDKENSEISKQCEKIKIELDKLYKEFDNMKNNIDVSFGSFIIDNNDAFGSVKIQVPLKTTILRLRTIIKVGNIQQNTHIENQIFPVESSYNINLMFVDQYKKLQNLEKLFVDVRITNLNYLLNNEKVSFKLEYLAQPNITYLVLCGLAVENLDGIEQFKNLEILELCFSNNLTSNISENIKLLKKLKKLTVTNCTRINDDREKIKSYCQKNKIETNL